MVILISGGGSRKLRRQNPLKTKSAKAVPLSTNCKTYDRSDKSEGRIFTSLVGDDGGLTFGSPQEGTVTTTKTTIMTAKTKKEGGVLPCVIIFLSILCYVDFLLVDYQDRHVDLL